MILNAVVRETFSHPREFHNFHAPNELRSLLEGLIFSTQNELPVAGYCLYQRKAFGLEDQVQWERATISAAQGLISGRVAGDLKGPARLFDLHPECSTF